MVNYDPKQWVRVLFSFQGTVLPRVLGRVIFMTVLALAIFGWQRITEEKPADEKAAPAKAAEPKPALNPLGHTLLGVALGLLIVFRNNSSYDRYWEGRKQWGGIVNASRNLVRGMAAYVGSAKEPARLVAAYALALKQHLRSNTDLSEIKELVPAQVFARISTVANPPSALAFYISAWIKDRVAENKLPPEIARNLESSVSALLDNQGACERILRTPIPFAYAVHIKQLLMLYLVTLPLVLVPLMGWMAPLATAAISFGLLGIEEAGVEIEDPFGDDPNDLPLEAICATVGRDTAALAEIASK